VAAAAVLVALYVVDRELNMISLPKRRRRAQHGFPVTMIFIILLVLFTAVSLVRAILRLPNRFVEIPHALQISTKPPTCTIPRTLVMTWKVRSEIADYVFNERKELNPGYKLKFFDNEQIVDFLTKEYNSTYVDFFNSMLFGRYKADFFRYCYLWKKGGVYADIDLEPKAGIDTFLDKDTTFFPCDLPSGSTVSFKLTWRVLQAILFYKEQSRKCFTTDRK
jgi:hypothetical protein